MSAICEVSKELYVPHPEPRVGTTVSMAYIGQGLGREETRSLVRSSDWQDTVRRRTSDDNGPTWSGWELLYEQAPTQGEFVQSGGPSQHGTGPLDPVSGRLVKPVFQRLVKGDPQVAMREIWSGNRLFCDHGFYQLSPDNGRSWGEARQLRYEDGPLFDPDHWADPDYYRTNEMYIGNATVLSNGTVAICATVPVPYSDPEDAQIPEVFPNNYRPGCVAGAICFLGRWSAARQDYDWQISRPVCLARRLSTRGLVELDLSELRSGNLLLLMRGSNTGLDPRQCPARKWFSVSADGGLTWSPVRDIRYDTGEPLYSPAAISQTLRSRRTARLYWIGNIRDQPPDGNAPRYPLQIVEIDEQLPAFRRDTVTVIDDRDPVRDSEHLQLSNFALLEDRETGALELYLTRLGERGGGPEVWTADAYRYRLTL